VLFVEEAELVTFFNGLLPKPAPVIPEGAGFTVWVIGVVGVAVVVVVVVAAGFTGSAEVAVVVAAGFAGGAEVAVAASAPGSAPAPVVSAGGVFVSAAASNPSFPLTTTLLEITVIKFVSIKVVINTIVMFLLKYVDMNPTDKNINKA
jgi:hypothetical protein